jgi:hypothetical protein
MLQGAGILQGSFMTGQILWLWIGVGVALLGLALANNGRPQRR